MEEDEFCERVNGTLLLCSIILLFDAIIIIFAYFFGFINSNTQLDDYINTIWSEKLTNSHIEEIKVGSIDSFEKIKAGDTSSVSYYCKNEKCSQVKFLIEDENYKDYFIPVVVQLNENSYFIPVKDCQEISNTCNKVQKSYPEQFEDLTIKQVNNNDYIVKVSSMKELKKNVSFKETQLYLDNIIEQSITISKRNYKVKEMLNIKDDRYKSGWK